jgi:DNA-binding XRE family transcriptional regulator
MARNTGVGKRLASFECSVGRRAVSLPTVHTRALNYAERRPELPSRACGQIDLAEETGIHENYVSDLEQGRKEACLRTLQTIATAFDLTVAELFKTVG